MKAKRSLNLKVVIGIFCLVAGLVAAFSTYTYAWIFYTNTSVNPTFDGSVVKSYFDEDSSSTTTDGVTTYNYIITRPVHLYNLAYLTDTGNLVESSTRKYVFQLGKQVNGTGNYYVYDSSSSTSLTSSILDMSSSSAYQEIPPIGTSTYEFSSIFNGNSITIKSPVIKDTILTGSSSYLTDVGLFGRIGDGASLKDFNIDGISVTTNSNNTNLVNLGLIIGYINQTTENSITYKSIGVKDGVFKSKSQVKSSFSLVGNGTEMGLSGANAAYPSGSSSAGDTGIVYFDEIFNAAKNYPDTMSEGRYSTTGDWSGKMYWTPYNLNETDTTTGYKYYYDNSNPFDPYVQKTDTTASSGSKILYNGSSSINIEANNMAISSKNMGMNFQGQRLIKGTEANALGVFNISTFDTATRGANWKNTPVSIYGNDFSYFDTFLTGSTPNTISNVLYSTGEYVDTSSTSITNSTNTNPTYYDMGISAGSDIYFNNITSSSGSAWNALYTQLSTTLHDKSGNLITSGDNFGVSASYKSYSDSSTKNITSFKRFYTINYSSSTTISASTNTYTDEDGTSYSGSIPNTISFKISNSYGANITIFASCQISSGTFLGIYSKGDSSRTDPKYAYFVPSYSTSSISYINSSGGTSTSSSSKSLMYAHTFYLPAGEYFIANTGVGKTSGYNPSLSIAYISVQGQQGGNSGNPDNTGFQLDFISDDSQVVGATGFVYSNATFAINVDPAETYVITFVRTDVSSVVTVTAYVSTGTSTNVVPVNTLGGVVTNTSPP